MMKRRRLLLVIYIGLAAVCMWGCSDESDEKDFTVITTPSDEGNSSGNEDDLIINKSMDMDYNSADSGFGMIMGHGNLIYSHGYGGSGNLIYIADLDTGLQVPLCNNVNCLHDKSDCNAKISSSVQYSKLVNDGIYYVETDFNNQTFKYGDWLHWISLDGTTRVEYGEIFEGYGDVSGISGWVYRLVDEYLYIIRGEEFADEESTDGFGLDMAIYRYKADGSEDIELIAKKRIEEGTNYNNNEFNVYKGYLYYFFNGCRRINLTTLEDEEVTEEMYYVSRYNDDGQILSCISDEYGVKTLYVYDEETKEKYYISESNSPDWIKKLTMISIKYYIDDKYVYIYDFDNNVTYVFDHKFNYVDDIGVYAFGTIGDRIVAQDDEVFVAIDRESMFDDTVKKYEFFRTKMDQSLEWNTYLVN